MYIFLNYLKIKVIKNNTSSHLIRIREQLIELTTPKIMGILNLTENSFYDGGKYNSIKSAILQTKKMIDEGALFVDIGVVSSKPGSNIISPKDEIKILAPYLKHLIKEFPNTFFSIDTYNSQVAKMSLDLGVSMINDISGGDIDPKMYSVVGTYMVPYLMMHMKGMPKTMQYHPIYDDIISEVIYSFSNKIKKARSSGINDILIDPGFGFGKNINHNFNLLNNLSLLNSLKCPIVVGVSRKSMIYKTLGCNPKQALNGTSVLNTLCLERGAKILRVHDVKEAKECISLWTMLH